MIFHSLIIVWSIAKSPLRRPNRHLGTLKRDFRHRLCESTSSDLFFQQVFQESVQFLVQSLQQFFV